MWVITALVVSIAFGCDLNDVDSVDVSMVKPDTTESPPVGEDSWSEQSDITSESLDSESTFVDSAGELMECIPTVPEGALVECKDYTGIFKVIWDLGTCKASIWRLNEDPPPIAKNVPPYLLVGDSGNEEYDFYCTPIDE